MMRYGQRRFSHYDQSPFPSTSSFSLPVHNSTALSSRVSSAGLGISFRYYWPTLLALVSRAAPAKVHATLMGLAFMSLFISNNLVGWIGGFSSFVTRHLSPVTRHFPLSFEQCTRPSPPLAAVLSAKPKPWRRLVVLFGRRLSRVLHPA